MNRRGFLHALPALAVAPLLAPMVRVAAPVAVQGLAFHKDAFSLVCAGLPIQRSYNLIQSQMVECIEFTLRPFGFVKPGRLTRDAIRAYGPPSRLPV